MSRIEKFTKLKRWSRKVAAGVNDSYIRATYSRDHVFSTGLTRGDLISKIDKFRSCCDVLEVRTASADAADLFNRDIEVHNASFCRQHLVCPLCAARIQNNRRRRFADPIKAAARKYSHAYIITFTVKDGEDLAERLGHLKDGMTSFRRMGQRRGSARSGGEWGKVRAALVSYEIKRGEGSGFWHTHAHGLVFTDSPIDYQVYDPKRKREIQKECRRDGVGARGRLDGAVMQWADVAGKRVPISKVTGEWLQSTGDSVSLDVSKVEGSAESVYSQAREVLKYVSKLNGQRQSDIIDIVAETFNKRFLNTYGDFRQVSDDMEADSIPEKSVSWSLTWDESAERYAGLRQHKGPVFEDQAEDSRKPYMGRQGRLLGEYRRQRRALVERMGLQHQSLARLLDEQRAAFVAGVRAIWDEYARHLARSGLVDMVSKVRLNRILQNHGIQTELAFSP